MTQLTTYEELIERVGSDPEFRTRMFEAFGLSALPALYSRMDSFEKTQQGILRTLEQHGEALVALREDFNSLSLRVDALDAKVDVLGTKVDVLGTKVDVLDTKVSRIEGHVHSLNSVVLGGHLEEKAYNVVYSRLRSLAGARLRSIELSFSARRSLQPDASGYTSPVNEAREEESISEEEHLRLLRTDLVYTASVKTEAGWETRWFPAEVSRTIGVDDVTRVTQSAEAIEKVFSQKVQVAVVAGTGIRKDAKDLAKTAGVKVVEFKIDGEEDEDSDD